MQGRSSPPEPLPALRYSVILSLVRPLLRTGPLAFASGARRGPARSVLHLTRHFGKPALDRRLVQYPRDFLLCLAPLSFCRAVASIQSAQLLLLPVDLYAELLGDGPQALGERLSAP